MENPFAKLVKEEEPSVEDDKNTQLEDAEKRLNELQMWQNDWTDEDRQLAEDLERQIEQLRGELEEE